MTLGTVCGKTKTYTSLTALICLGSSLSHDDDLLLRHHVEISMNFVGRKLTLGLAIISASILADYYILQF